MASIEKRGKNAYRVSWREGGGRNDPRKSKTFKDPAAARRYAALIELNGERAPLTKDTIHTARLGDGQRLTFEAWSQIWLAELAGVQPRTLHDYQRAITNHMLPAFGDLDVLDPDEFTRSTVRQWVRRLTDSGAQPKTVYNLHGLLYNIMQGLVTRDPQPLRPSNPCTGTRLPRKDAATEAADEIGFLTPDEFWLIHSCIADPNAQDVVVVLAGTGLRWGEMSALKTSDLDLAATPPTLTVRRAWKDTRTAGWVLGPPKTPAARRTIAVDETVAEILARHSATGDPDDYVFTGARGNPLRNHNFHTHHWQPALKLASDPGTQGDTRLRKKPRIHDLRHTHAAWLISQGCDLAIIKHRLGHESIQTTVDVYGGLLVEAQHKALPAISAAFRQGRPLPALPA